MVLNNIYVKNVSANAGKDWAGDGEAVRQPQHINTSADNYANCANWHYGSWVTSQNCVAEMLAVFYDLILSNIYTLLATSYSLL